MAIPRRLNSGNRFERSQNRDVKRVVFLSVETSPSLNISDM